MLSFKNKKTKALKKEFKTPISPKAEPGSKATKAVIKKTRPKRFAIRKFKILSIRSGLDLPFLLLVLSLVTVGIVMMFSASYPNAYYLHHGDSFFFIRNQAIFAAIGIAIMFLISKIDYENFRWLALPLLIVSFVLLVAVLLMPPVNGVRRWITLGPIGFQPSELTKFAIVVFFAHLITKNFDKMSKFRYGVIPFLVVLAPTLVLLALEPHISCTVIVVLLGGLMLFVGGVKLRWFGSVFGLISMALGYIVIFTEKLTYANNRIAGWLNPFNTPPGVDAWQTRQSLYAIGSGGILGLGLGNSRQKYLYIPEPQNDFIFAVVCEELGFLGAAIILILFAMLIWRGVVIAIRSKDKFGSLLAIGLTMQVGLQTILNIAVVTNTIPNTGISLPFFSYGGTSLLMLLAQMGIILSISRSAKLEKS
ncbi:MAG: putative lipid II flippase FtsW [Oscillospiraceae bacterium]|jgi:cell division protein FtsW|nr:putative lipid II flippase FtsW [Oscillospiraceae bacterium]